MDAITFLAIVIFVNDLPVIIKGKTDLFASPVAVLISARTRERENE